MAGDWIKMRVDLDVDPAVIAIADAHNLAPLTVVGMLWKVWAWGDQHLRDGHARGVTPAFLDRITQQDGFARSMEEVGWLKILSTGVSFPDFDKHNGKPAKERALTNRRVKRHRNGAAVTPPLPEKRRSNTTQAATRTRTVEPEPEPAASGSTPTPPPDLASQIIAEAAKVQVDLDSTLAEAWAKSSTIGQVRKALEIARSQGRKPAPEPCPANYVSPILREIVTADRKAKRAADARVDATKTLVAEQLAAKERASPMPEELKPRRPTGDPDPPHARTREADEFVDNTGQESELDDSRWWESPEAVMARAVELNVQVMDGQAFEDFTARVMAAEPGEYLQQLPDEMREKVDYFAAVGVNSEAARHAPS